MMGYKESIAQELSLGDNPLFQRIHNLRPIIPNPYLSPPNHNHLSNSCLNHLHHHHHHHDFGNNNNNNNNNKGGVEENNRSKEEGSGGQQVMVSSRWNPTPEQLTALEELYRCGTRTPSAEQIQHITAQLRRYGKIEGKNVFYWFQNHKARERQKRRRQLQPHANANHVTDNNVHHQVFDKGFEEEEEKNGKRALFITNNKESDHHPIQQQSPAAAAAAAATTISTTVTTAPSSKAPTSPDNSLHCFFQFPHQFQHPTYTNNNYHITPHCPNNNNYVDKNIFQGNVTWSHPPRVTLLPRTISDDHVVAPTLELFPVLKNNNGDTKKKKEETGDSLVNDDDSKDNEKIVGCCMDSSSNDDDDEDFVPYYQFL